MTNDNELEIDKSKQNLTSKLEMTNLGKVLYFLGNAFVTTKHGIFLIQKNYTTYVLNNSRCCNATMLQHQLKLEPK